LKKLIGVLAGIALVVGSAALATPTPAAPRYWPHCKNHSGCGAPEPGSCPGPCQYWEWCGEQCGCKKIPGCKA
jgi:hypothetical protein